MAYLESIDAFKLLSKKNTEALITIYFSTFNTFFPILNEEKFRKLYAEDKCPTVILYSVILVAARETVSKKYLEGDSVRHFCSSTVQKIKALLFSGVEKDRLVLLRVYALLAQHAEGPEGLEDASMYLHKAVQYAVILGLHHERPFVDREEMSQLWWSIFCLDRISSYVNANPLHINRHDMSIQFPKNDSTNYLSKMVQVCLRLERVLSLYQPNGDRRKLPKDINEPIFFYDKVGNKYNDILAVLEYAGSIVAHKYNEPLWSSESESDIDEIKYPKVRPPLKSRKTSSDKVSKYIGSLKLDDSITTNQLTELPSNSDRSKALERNQKQLEKMQLLNAAFEILKIIKYNEDLPCMFFIPYCISLTLTVFLRTYPEIAEKRTEDTFLSFSWKDSVEMLSKLSDKWWIAKVMSRMGESIFNALDKERSNTNNTSANASNSNSTVQMNMNTNMNYSTSSFKTQKSSSRSRSHSGSPRYSANTTPVSVNSQAPDNFQQMHNSPFPTPDKELNIHPFGIISNNLSTGKQQVPPPPSLPQAQQPTVFDALGNWPLSPADDVFENNPTNQNNNLSQTFENVLENEQPFIATTNATTQPHDLLLPNTTMPSQGGYPAYNNASLEEQFLMMFSELPNTTSFLSSFNSSTNLAAGNALNSNSANNNNNNVFNFMNLDDVDYNL